MPAERRPDTPMAIVPSWIETHCIIPDGFRRGRPFRLYDGQLLWFRNFYLVRGTAEFDPVNPMYSTAFRYRRALDIGPQKVGKALALDTPIPTPTGWTTMGEVEVGDLVFDEQGHDTAVIEKSLVWLVDAYRVTFSDGASLVTSGDHRWYVERRTPSSTYVPEWTTTADMAGRLVDKGGARRFRIRAAAPIDCESAQLPIEPYTLGAWLGDGNSADGRITGIDQGIFDEIAAAGHELRMGASGDRVSVVGLATRLKGAGLLGDKRIPDAYFRAAIGQRLALLQGLMDTDGTIGTRGRCEFTTTKHELAAGMRQLLWGLGIKHRIGEGRAMLNGRDIGPKWRIGFAARGDLPPFRLERKLARLKAAGGKHAQYRHRRIVAIEPIPTVATQCLTVAAASSLFLAGREMIPTGNSPKSAAHICVEAVGPTVFADWAGQDDGYACADHGCGCGWEYAYEPGEPMGMLRPTPWIQIIAVSEDGTGNVYKALRPMIELGPLAFLLPKTGENFIRLPGDGLIEPVTSSDTSRVGARGTFVVETEVGFYTPRNGMTKVADTLHRNLAGMSARAALESNSWDPSQHSTAQSEFELADSGKVDDVYVQVTWPPKNLSYANKADRRKIHRIVYPEDTRRENGGHVDLEAIEGEAAAMVEKDLPQASRFFGNGRESGAGHAFDIDRWKAIAVAKPHDVPAGALIVIGFDGSKRWDHASMIATEVASGYQWPLGIWRPEDYRGHEIPVEVVTNVLDQAMSTWDVWRLYADPPYWEDTIAGWAGRWGRERVVEWWTNRPKAMAYALRSWEEAQRTGAMSHCALDADGCALFSWHVGNAFKDETGYRDDGGVLWVATKERDGSPNKIDSVPAATLSWEARNDALTAGALNLEPVDETEPFVIFG